MTGSTQQRRDDISPGALPQRFLYKGMNGRWQDVLTPAELEQYKAAAGKQLSPDCQRWLEGQS